MYPKSLNDLIEALRVLPGVGLKTAERYALSLLDEDLATIEAFSKAILSMKQNIGTCRVCHNLTETDVCSICSDPKGDQTTLCVVSSAKEVFSIEKTNEYKGVYHVLGGLISTQKGILPEDLNIESLIHRIQSNTQEVILGLNATVEGEITSLYLAKRLESQTKVTRLAFGLPIGGHLDYADDMTLMKAFEGRNQIK